MSIGCFTDKQHQPVESDVRQVIGSRLLLREALIQHGRDAYPAQGDFKFLYGKNYGWALRFRIKGQVLTSLFPAQGRFRCPGNLSPGAVERALAMQLGGNVQRLLVLRAEDKSLTRSSVIRITI